MPRYGHFRTSTFRRCAKHKLFRRFSSISSRNNHHQKKQRVSLLLSTIDEKTLNFNSSAFTDVSPKPFLRSSTMLPTFNQNQDFSPMTKIPQAPPLPANFSEKLSTETLKSTDFTKAIKSRTSSITPSGTDLSQSMLIRPSQITEPPPIIQMGKSKTYCNPIIKPSLRNRRRTPLTPDVLALTKLRRPEHIKSSIVQRIEELKQASLVHPQSFDEKLDNRTDVLITCEYKNNNQERKWLEEQSQKQSTIRFLNTKNNVELNNRLFQIRTVEFLDHVNVRFHAQEKLFEENFLNKYLKQISIITILILSILRLIENTLSNLAIPGIQIILNLIYVFILTTVASILITNQK
ncbi:unnamed protein product [Adineta ricciae]|uniref:Uncharacterized protein n=1 Tax=Adineta ricciae TaxID=249248 RepID=A0A815X159_ADIRI|nr:unnamed protein product [Adineta ricciae]